MDNIFFQNWESVLRTVIITILAYIGIVLLLRISGKRTLSKMNAFDFIVTIALGSSLATVALNKNVPLLEGILVFFLLIFLQFSLTWLSVRVSKVKNLVSSQPTLLLYNGNLLHDELKKQRITVEEMYLAARKKGVTDFESVGAIVLEATGDIVVIKGEVNSADRTMEDVSNLQRIP